MLTHSSDSISDVILSDECVSTKLGVTGNFVSSLYLLNFRFKNYLKKVGLMAVTGKWGNMLFDVGPCSGVFRFFFTLSCVTTKLQRWWIWIETCQKVKTITTAFMNILQIEPFEFLSCQISLIFAFNLLVSWCFCTLDTVFGHWTLNTRFQIVLRWLDRIFE